jgi:hypothetical protein
MRKSFMLVFAALLGSGAGYVTSSPALAADQTDGANRSARETSAQPELPAGFQMKDLGQLDNVRDELSKVTEEAMTRGDFGKVISELAVDDRDRMKDYKNQDFKTYDGVVDQLNKDWNQKYGHDFNIRKADNVWTDRYIIVQGIVINPAIAAANWPVQPEANAPQLASEQRQGQSKEVEAQDLKKADGVALSRIPASHGLPQITASMIRERGHGWVFDISDDISSQQLHTQLQNQLSYVGQHVDQWPADETEAYRMVAHRVVMALYNVNAPESGHAARQ